MNSNEKMTPEIISDEEISSDSNSDEDMTVEVKSNDEITSEPEKKEKITTDQRKKMMSERLVAWGLPLSLFIGLCALVKDIVKEFNLILFYVLAGFVTVLLVVYFAFSAYYIRWTVLSNHAERIKEKEKEKEAENNRKDEILLRQETRNRRKREKRGRKLIFSLAKSLKNEGFKINESQMQQFQSIHQDMKQMHKEIKEDQKALEKKENERDQKLDALYEIICDQKETIEEYIEINETQKKESKIDQFPKKSKYLERSFSRFSI